MKTSLPFIEPTPFSLSPIPGLVTFTPEEAGLRLRHANQTR